MKAAPGLGPGFAGNLQSNVAVVLDNRKDSYHLAGDHNCNLGGHSWNPLGLTVPYTTNLEILRIARRFPCAMGVPNPQRRSSSGDEGG